MSVEFGMPLEALGVLFAVSLVGFVLVSFASGSLIRRRSIHWLILTSLVLRAIGFFGFTFAPNWHFLILSIFVLSLGGGGMDTGLNGFISARGNAKQLNWLHASYGVGATVGPFLASAVATLDGTWRWNFGFLAALLLLVSVLVWVSRPAWGLALKETDSNKGAGTRQTMRLPIVWISVLIFFLYTGTELAAGQWSFTLFTIGRGETELAARFWVGIYWGAFTVGRILFGFIADRICIDRFLRFGIIAVVTGAGLLWWNPVTWDISCSSLAEVTFEWEPVSGASSYEYQIQSANAPDGPFSGYASGETSGTEANEDVICGSSIYYRWRVMALNATSDGPWSDWSVFKAGF